MAALSCLALLAGLAALPSAVGKAGIALDLNNDPADLQHLTGSGVWWNYNWAMNSARASGVEYVPMVWGQGSVGQLQSLPYTSHLLGFNEPNMPKSVGGSDMSPQLAAQLWPQVEAAAQQHGVQQLVGPAVANRQPVEWYDAFFGSCPSCRVDAIAIHAYSCDLPNLRNLVDSMKRFNRPLWLTEFACADNPTALPNNPSGSKAWYHQCDYMGAVLPYLNDEPAVQRYAWFSQNSGYVGESQLLSNGVWTQVGGCYVRLVSQLEGWNATLAANATSAANAVTTAPGPAETLVLV